MNTMILIIGLGNPGRKYKKTRHNIGFRIIDEFQKENSFPKFKFLKKFQAEISEGIIGGKKVILAKPQTYMNSSGRAVKAIFQFYKISLSDLIIIHDDLDLPIGEVKISKDRGSGGHKGVESIIQEMGSKNFLRMRLGIKAKSVLVGGKNAFRDYVLGKFSREETQFLKKTMAHWLEEIKSMIERAA